MNPRGSRNSGSYRRRRPSGVRRAASALPALFIVALLMLALSVGCIILLNAGGNLTPVEPPGTSEAEQSSDVGITGTQDVTDSSDTADSTGGVTDAEPVAALPEFEFPQGLYSKAALLYDATHNSVLASKNADERIYPASLTKIMTVITAIDALDDINAESTLSAEMFDYLYRANASVAGFLPGETVKAKDLMYAAMLPSGADGSIGLAELIAGSEKAFADMMNEKAKALGMTGSHFVNVTGLHDDNHYTTASDLLILIKYAMSNADFAKIITTPRYSTSPTNLHTDGITFYSTVFSSFKAAGIENKYVIGGKTGYTGAAGMCLCSIAEVGGNTYYLITLGAGDGTNSERWNIYDAEAVYEKLDAVLASADG